MKKNKIIGLLVAAAGTVASISVASALYTKSASDIGFGIGAKYRGHSGTITYLIDGSASGSVDASYLDKDGHNGGKGFGGVYTQAHFSFPLSATFSSDMAPQVYVVGNFSVNLTNISETLQNHAKIWVGVDGYTANTYGDVNFSHAFMSSDTALTGSSYAISRDLAVSSAETESVEIYVKLDSAVPEADMLSLAEGKAFDLDVSWGAPADYDFAYVSGEGNKWKEDEYYAMVPNVNKPNSEGFQWMFSNLSSELITAKCRQGDVYSGGSNFNLEEGKTYDVYWDGLASSDASFIPQTHE